MGAVKIEGLTALQNAIQNFSFDLDKAIDDAVRMTAIDVNREAIKLIKTPSHSGRFVQRTKDGKTHEISASGEAPNSDTGRLIGSVTFTHTRGAQLALVGTNLDYGAILETEMNRPWLEPAKKSQIKSFDKRMRNAIDSQIKKAGK